MDNDTPKPVKSPVGNPVGMNTLDLGATVESGGVRYTVWAPDHSVVSAAVQSPDGNRNIPLQRVGAFGYFSGLDTAGSAGDFYTFQIDDDRGVPDVASGYQRQGVLGPSEVIDPAAFVWRTPEWKRPAWEGSVVYELHIGTFTPAGTFRSAIEALDHLEELGVTAVEVMPIAACAGARNWGYDGVFLFAPNQNYGTPDDFRSFVDACHARGLAVILDVVYNHLGPVGNHCHRYTKHFFHTENESGWGQNFDLDGPQSAPVRAFLLQNLRYWMKDFKIDGFRLDATHAIPDHSPKHVIAEASQLVRGLGGFLIAEDERNCAEVLNPDELGGWNCDGCWADDFHHTLYVGQKRPGDVYVDSYDGSAAELADILENGWLYRGQFFPLWDRPRGGACKQFAPSSFVFCISNHDQIGNRPFGERLNQLMSPESYRALSLLVCLTPYTPLLFMGQEWGASSPFFYFTDMPGDIEEKIEEGRLKDFRRLNLISDATPHKKIPSPQDENTFIRSKLDWDERTKDVHQKTLALYQAALRLRKELFGSSNPARNTWKIGFEADTVTICYELDGGTVSVHIRLGSNSPVNVDSNRLLLRSNTGEFGGNPDSRGPETWVTQD